MRRSQGNIRIQTIQTIEPPKVHVAQLAQEVPLYHVSGGHEPVLHLELIFKAGRAQEAKPAAAHATAALIADGAETMTSREISEAIDFYGATLRATSGVDAMSVSLYTMGKHFEPTLELLIKILGSATFPESELRVYKQNRAQKIRIAMQQNETIANKLLSKAIFGTHPYGYTTEAADVAGLDRAHVMDHYQLLGSQNLSVFLSGQIQDEHLQLLNDAINNIPAGQPTSAYNSPEAQPVQQIRQTGPQKYQAALRLGRQVVDRRHHDFPAIFLLNTILGGFFGARLMKNIREEKGLTYGIYSTLETLVRGACWIISTETAGDKSDRVLREIDLEIRKLQDSLVTPSELEMVRNYLMGTLLMQLDGPLKSMDMVKTMIMESLDEQYFVDFVEAIKTTTPEDIRSAAQKYLDPADLSTVVVR